MRILHTADWHLGKTIEGRSRIEEQRAFLRDFAEIARRERADLVIVAGDIYDSPNPSAEAEKLFYQSLKEITQDGKRLILVIAGNHDSPERLVAAGPLAADHGILMAGLPGTVIPVGSYGLHRVVASGNGYVEIEINGERAVILFLPYPSEKRLNDAIYREMDESAERAASYGEKIARLFAELEGKYREDTVNLAAAHLFAMDVTAGGSERGLELGGSYLVDGACLPPKAGYIALGHVHKFQLVPHTQGRAYYSGSPIAYHRREAGSEKMCILAEGKAGQSFRVKEIPLPVYKPIQVWRAKSPEEAIELCRLHSEEDSWVYLEVETERGYILEDEIRRMKELKKDILEIHPIVPGEDDPEGTDFSASGYEKTCPGGIGEKTLPEVFADYFRQEMKGAVPEQELIELLLELSREDGKEEAYEASEAKDQGPEQFYKRTDD